MTSPDRPEGEIGTGFNENEEISLPHVQHPASPKDMLSILLDRQNADVRFIAKGGYNIFAHQKVLKSISKKLYEWCVGYSPGESTRFIVVSNVCKESVEEFLQLLYSDELSVSESLTPDLFVEVLYLFEKFCTMDKFFKLQNLYLDQLKKNLSSLCSVVVFVKAREFRLKDIEHFAWGLIRGFVKNVVKFDFTQNNESMKAFFTKEGIPLDMSSHFESLLRFAQPVILISDTFTKSTEFKCMLTLISFVSRLKWSITEFGDAACFGTENIVKFLNADTFYSFAYEAFIDKDIIIPYGENNRVMLLNGQVPKKTNSKGKSSFTTSLRRIRPEGLSETPSKEHIKEYHIHRLFSCSEFIFPNLGNAEAMSFVSDTAIKLVKLGLYGCQEVPPYIDQYCVRATILDPKKNSVIGSVTQIFHNTGVKYYIKFPTAVPIKPHKMYIIAIRAKGPPSCIGLTKQDMVKVKCNNAIVTLYFPPDDGHGMRIPDIVFTL